MELQGLRNIFQFDENIMCQNILQKKNTFVFDIETKINK